MDIIQTIVLGLVQGLGEFLPISSSGHLILTPWLFGWEDPGLSFDIALHFGTLLAVIAYFWRDWVAIFGSFLGIPTKIGADKKYPRNFLLLLIVATIPGVVAGLVFEDKAETILRNPAIIAIALIVFGLILFLADVYTKKKKEARSITFADAFLIGCAQALAIIPGTSRSGVTISAALFLGLGRREAAKFSFLLSTPIIFGATMMKASEFLEAGIGSFEVVGILVSALSGFLAITTLLKFVEKVSYRIFFWYRIALAILIIFLMIGR